MNDAFIIDNATKEALICEDPKSAEIIKPVLKGGDIQRFQAHWNGRWLIATFPSLKIDIKNYPAVEKQLESFGRDRLEQTGKRLANGEKSRKKTPHKWYELQDTCAYHAEFRKEKLTWIQLVDDGRFSYDASGKLCEASTCIMTGEGVKFLCAVLNSKLIRWYFQQFAPTSGKGTSQWKKAYVERIYVPKGTTVQQSNFINLVDQIITAKSSEVETSPNEYEIDRQVYKLYNFSKNEIEIVEKYFRRCS